MSAVVRPRGHWEAIDLGIRLVRPHYARMLWVSLLLTAPFFAAIHLVFWNHLAWGGLLMWWLKPLWERVHLHALSRRLFGEAPTTAETLRAFGSYGTRQWLAWLTIRRFSPTRSLDLPITQLEALSGKPRRQRIDLLHRGSTSTGGVWLTVVCANLEIFLAVAFLISLQLLAPTHVEFSLFDWLFGEASHSRIDDMMLNLLTHAIALAVAPFYVGGGFGLYINRRTILEGWDLEIAFRRTASRVRALSAGRGAALASPLWLAALVLGFSSGASDADAATEVLTRERAAAAIEELLDSEMFHEKRTTRVPRLLLDWEFEEAEEEEPRGWRVALERALVALVRGIAALGEVILIALMLALVGYAIYRSRDQTTAVRRRERNRLSRSPGVLLGLDLDPESLPDDVAGAVLEIWRRGAKRDALALLYRATLSELAHVHGVAFAAGSTESDCLATVARSASPGRVAFFRELTEGWERLAYAHRGVSTAALESLCASWSALFDRARAEPGEAASDG